jgi:hypothetical protein
VSTAGNNNLLWLGTTTQIVFLLGRMFETRVMLHQYMRRPPEGHGCQAFTRIVPARRV